MGDFLNKVMSSLSPDFLGKEVGSRVVKGKRREEVW